MTEAGVPPQNPAEAYERFIAQNIFVAWTADLLQRAGPRRGSRVLDLACGTGIVARQVAPLLGSEGSLTGLDISPAMLNVARSLMPNSEAKVEWHEGSGTQMPFPDESFDLVLCQQGLQFFPDHQTGMNEIRRVLAPGGKAVVSVWRDIARQPFMKAIDEVASRHLAPGALSLPFSLSDAAQLEALARTAGFEQVGIEQPEMSLRVKDPDNFAPMMLQAAAAVLPQFADLTPEARQSVIQRMNADLAEAIQPFRDGDELLLDTATNVLIAQR